MDDFFEIKSFNNHPWNIGDDISSNPDKSRQLSPNTCSDELIYECINKSGPASYSPRHSPSSKRRCLSIGSEGELGNVDLSVIDDIDPPTHLDDDKIFSSIKKYDFSDEMLLFPPFTFPTSKKKRSHNESMNRSLKLSHFDQNFVNLKSSSDFLNGCSVHHVKNKLDGVCYSIKEIELNQYNEQEHINLLRNISKINTLSKINKYVLRYYYSWREENLLYIQEEDFDHDLSSESFDVPKFVKFIRQMLISINTLHNNNYVHGKIQSNNIYVHEDTFKLGDGIYYQTENLCDKNEDLKQIKNIINKIHDQMTPPNNKSEKLSQIIEAVNNFIYCKEGDDLKQLTTHQIFQDSAPLILK